MPRRSNYDVTLLTKNGKKTVEVVYLITSATPQTPTCATPMSWSRGH
ncbi:hypothetical protein [Actinomadura rubteroloni]|nr:hypothetical protein [Actinomadura rubteroloni]